MNRLLDDQPHIPTVMPTSNRPLNAGAAINNDTSRLDAVAKVTGGARYGRDVYLPNALFACFIRCPYGAAELEEADTAAAQAVPGVVEVEVRGKRGQYHGHDVGHIVAESKLALARALNALNPRWKRQPVKTRITDGMEAAPQANDDANQALGAADHVLEAVYTTAIQTHSSLETHGSVADHRGQSATLYCSTQGTSSARDGLEREFGLDQSQIEVVCEYVGGGFGSKLNGAGKEGSAAARLSARHKRPVYFFANREEEHLDTGNRPSSRTSVRLGIKNDGTILGGQVHVWGGVGVGGGGGASVPSGRYNLGKVQRSQADVRHNGGPPAAFRAPGSPQGAFAEELALDELATLAGIDPLALRKKLDRDDDRRTMMDQGADLIGWKDRRPTGSQRGALRRGFGMGTASWGRFPNACSAEVVINRDGSVQARTGTQDIGTGQRTVMGVVAADTLGIPLALVDVRIGSSTLPPGPGSGGSVTAHNSAPAMTLAADDAKRQLLAAVAAQLNADAAQLSIAEGHILRNNEPVVAWKDACARLPDAIVGRGRWDRQTRDADRSTGHSNGVQFVDLTVDTETGVIRVHRIVAIQACGRVVCRKTAESQIIGGVIQGISYALFEDQVLDRHVGSMVNANFDMYKIAGTADMPHIIPVLFTSGQTGVRSLGEPPTIPTSGAIACAVFNAIGRPVRDLPLRPDRVLAALEGGAA